MTLLDQLLITVVTAFATAILAYFGFWRQAKAELQKEYETRFNEKKWEVYMQFMELIPSIRQVSEEKLNQREAKSDSRDFYWSQDDLITNEEYLVKTANCKTSEQELHNQLLKVEEKLLLIGSSITVKNFLKWKDYAESNPIYEDEKGIRLFIELINTMREDLGNIKSKLNLSDFDGTYFISKKRKKENEMWRKEQLGDNPDAEEFEELMDQYFEENGEDFSPEKIEQFNEKVERYFREKREIEEKSIQQSKE